jgi:hypothetical protein
MLLQHTHGALSLSMKNQARTLGLCLRKCQNVRHEFLRIVAYEVQTNLHTSALRTRIGA